MSKRYYWLKLNENFFEREEIKIIENMPNGKDYIIFYLKLLLKSISTKGELKFRDIIPYTPEMLSAITGTDIDTVRVAIDLFTKLDLMEIWDDGTLFMVETQKMIGSETDSARRVRKHRAKKAIKEGQENKMLQSNNDETKSNTDIDIDIDKDIELDTDKDVYILSNDEKEFLDILTRVENYPLDREKDLEMYKTLKERYPELDLLEAIENWRLYKLDKPLAKNSNPRSQINNSFKKYVEWGKCLKKGDSNGANKNGNRENETEAERLRKIAIRDGLISPEKLKDIEVDF